MALRFVSLAFDAVLRILVRRRDDLAREAEIVILRHERAVRRGAAGRARFDWADQAVISALARVVARDGRDRLILTPANVTASAVGSRPASLSPSAPAPRPAAG